MLLDDVKSIGYIDINMDACQDKQKIIICYLAPKCIRINNLLKQDADILYYRQFATQDIQAESRYSFI